MDFGFAGSDSEAGVETKELTDNAIDGELRSRSNAEASSKPLDLSASTESTTSQLDAVTEAKSDDDKKNE